MFENGNLLKKNNNNIENIVAIQNYKNCYI